MSRISELRSNRTHRWKVLGIGVAANASFSAAFQGIPTTAVLMRSGYHLDNSGLGLALGLLGLGIAISELPWGMLTDRWGDRRVLLAGLGTTAVALALMAKFVSPMHGYVPPFLWLASGLLLIGLLGGSVNGSSGRAVMNWFAEGERGLAMSIRQTAVPLGGGLGAAILPGLASRLGFAAVFGGLALFCAVATLLTWWWLYEPSTSGSATTSPGRGIAPPAEMSPLRDPVIWRLVLAIGILCAPQFAILTFATVFLHDFAHAGVVTLSLTMLSVQTLAMVSRVWSGRWTDRRGNRRDYLRGCTILSIFAFLVLTGVTAWYEVAGTGGGAVILAIVVAVSGLFVSAWHGVAFAELATLAGARRVGTSLGMANSCVFVAFFLTPVSIPALISWWSWPSVWLASGLCALIALPLFPRPVRATRPATAVAS